MKLEMRFCVQRAQRHLEDHVVILRADIDIRNLSPGFYFVGLRQLGPEWNPISDSRQLNQIKTSNVDSI